MTNADVLELMAISSAAAAVLGALHVHTTPPTYALVHAANAAAADATVQGPARAQLGAWLRAHSAELFEEPARELRTALLQVRLTAQEQQQLQYEAAQARVPVAALVRQRLFGTP